jgi:type II secretory ATPase GspE/PulE/Tfp pilus assembly ATPase PilB-like protein
MRDALAARSPIRYEDAGMPTLIHDGLEKVRLGLTTLEELARIRHV